MPQHQAARSRGADRVEPRRLVSLAELDAVGEAQGHEPVLCRKRRRVWNISSKAESPSGLGVAPPAGRPAATPVSSPCVAEEAFSISVDANPCEVALLWSPAPPTNVIGAESIRLLTKCGCRKGYASSF